MWFLRNTHQHDTKDTPVNFKKLQLLQEIRECYELKNQMLSADRDIFSTSFVTRENHTIMQLQEYAKFAKQITKQSIADAKEHGKHFKTIERYFSQETKKKNRVRKVNKAETNKKCCTWKRNIQGTLESHLRRPPPNQPILQPPPPQPGERKKVSP